MRKNQWTKDIRVQRGMSDASFLRVKIPATIQLLRLGYEYQSLREAVVDFSTKIFINRFKPALEKLNGQEFSYDEIKKYSHGN